MKPPNDPELRKFYEHTAPLSTETLGVERDALHAMILDIGPKLYLIRQILNERKPV
jgi:hypothetical protein